MILGLASQSPFNNASGGSTSTFVSTGQAGTVTGATYRVHTFTSDGTFQLVKSILPSTFDYLIVAAGGGSGQGANENMTTSANSGGGGGGGAGGAGGQSPNGWETDPGSGVSNTITGSSLIYCGGGQGYASATHGQSGGSGSSYGGGAAGVNGQFGYGGQNGVVIIRYRIA